MGAPTVRRCLLRVAAGLPARLAVGRPGRRSGRLGRPRAGVARLRRARRGTAGGGFVGGACGARAVRGVGQLAPPRGGADVGHRGALGGGRRRARRRGSGARGRPHRGSRPGDRPHHHGGRAAASGVPRGVRLTAGAQGLHHRARADDRRRSVAEVVRPRAGGRRVRREGLGPVHRAGGDQRVGGGRRRGFAGAAAAPAALRPPGAVGDGRGAGRGVGLGAAGPARAWGGRRRVRSRAVCRRSGCPSCGSRTTARSLSAVRSASPSSGSPRASAAAKTYATKAGYDIDARPRAARGRGGERGDEPVRRDGGSGSLSKTAVNGGAGARSQTSGLVVAVLTVVTLLLLHWPVRAAARGHARRCRHRRRHRTHRHPRPAQAVPDLDQPARGDLRPGSPRRLPRRARGPARRTGVRHPAGAVHRHRHLGPAAALPRVAAERRRARPDRGPRSRLGRPRPPPGGRADAGRGGRARGGGPCSSRTPTTYGPGSAGSRSPGTPAPSSSTPRPRRRST